jgi:hypothetical protein
VGVTLIFPPDNKSYYEEVKEKYLATRYAEGLQALDVEEFSGAEQILGEVLSIDGTYKDAKTHWITAKYEPVYRRGIQEYNNQLYRKSYYSFDEIIKGTGTYKDALDQKAIALEKALITVAVAPFYNYNAYGQWSATLNQLISKKLSQTSSPFYKVVTDPVIATLPENGKKSRIPELIPYLSAYSQSIAAKAVLTGSLSRVLEEPGTLTMQVKTGYLKTSEEYKDETTGQTKTRVVYKKVNYKEYTQTNKSTVAFEFSLIDVAKGTILVSDVYNLSNSSQVHYATYQGDVSKLVPGYWKQIDKDSPEDVISDNQTSVSQLKELINANKEIQAVSVLTNEICADISARVVKTIESFNPEK